MKKTLLATVLLLFTFPLAVSFAEADVVDQIGGTIAQAPYVMSPANTTYTSATLVLNVSFHAAMYGNLNYSMAYSLDGSKNKTLPLTSNYFGLLQQDKNYLNGSMVLPQLNSGSHKVAVYVKCYMFSNWNESSDFASKSFYDSQTVYFTTAGNGPPISIQLVTALSIVVLVAVVVGVLVYFKRKNK